MTSVRHRIVAAAALVALAAAAPALAAPKDWSGSPGGPGNSGGGSGGTDPILSFSADQPQYAVGDTALLSWASVGTRFCNASGDWSGKFGVEGTYRTPPLTGPATYTLKCASTGGGVSQTVTVDVVQPEAAALPAPAPSVTLEASPTSVNAGDSVTLNWSSTDADRCDASGGWSGTYGPSGSVSVGPLDADTTFLLSCTGAGGTTGGSVSVTVSQPLSPSPLPTVSLQASPSSVVAGDSVLLSWTSTDADACTAGGAWSGSYGPSGSVTVGPLDADATFTLDCSGAGGSATGSVAVSVSQPAPTPAPVVQLNVSPTTVTSGEPVTLTWTADNADTCSASGGWSGDRAPSGSETTGGLTASTTFALSCSGAGGTAATSATVTVTAPPTPTLSFTSADSVVASGGSTTLNWSATDADTCTASGGWSGVKATSGAEAVGPVSGNTTFSLACTGAGGSVVEMLSIDAMGTVTISWAAPTENVDGTPLTDLAGYRIYYGSESRNYTDTIPITDPATTSHSFAAASGDYYLGMTAIDSQGNESALSNEVLKTVP